MSLLLIRESYLEGSDSGSDSECDLNEQFGLISVDNIFEVKNKTQKRFNASKQPEQKHFHLDNITKDNFDAQISYSDTSAAKFGYKTAVEANLNVLQLPQFCLGNDDIANLKDINVPVSNNQICSPCASSAVSDSDKKGNVDSGEITHMRPNRLLKSSMPPSASTSNIKVTTPIQVSL